MEFKFTINPYDENPAMILSGVIGTIPTDNGEREGVSGKEFQRELLYLDSIGCKSVDLFINTPGGRLSDLYDIFMAVKSSKCKVNTICYGMAASAGFILLQAGRKREMYDIAVAMTHGVYNPFVDGQDEASKAMQNGLIAAVSNRIGMPEEETAKLFEGENWYNANKCKELNFCDNVINTGLMNKPKGYPEPANIVNASKQYDLILNLSQPKPNMILLASVKDVLNLGGEATEQDILQKIAELKRGKQDAENKAADLQRQIDEFSSKLKEQEIETILNQAVQDGKIAEAVKPEYVNLFKGSFDATKALIDKLPVNKAASQLTVTPDNSRGNGTEGIPADRAEWTHLDWQMKDPEGLKNLMNKYPETEKALYKKTYLK